MLVPTIVFSVLALVFTFLNAKNNNHLTGFKTSFKQLKMILPLVLLAVIMSGLIEVLIPEQIINDWLARDAGFRGILVGSLGGAVLAMGPYASFPIIASIYAAGAGFGTVVALVTSWSLLSFMRVPYEGGLLGAKFTSMRMAFSIPFCIMAGMAAHMLENIFF